MQKVRFAPFISEIEIPFYSTLASHKINHDKLDDSARKLLGLYEIRSSDTPESSCRMQVHQNALTSNEVPTGYYRAEGMIKNVNTIEEYKNFDKAMLLQQAGRTIWEAIQDGTIYSCPSLLASFVVLSFANLKKYKFSTFFAFPALHTDQPWTTAGEASEKSGNDSGGPNELEKEELTGIETTSLVDSVQTWRYGVDARQHGFFLAKRVRHGKQPGSGDTGEGKAENVGNAQENHRPITPKSPGEILGYSWSVSSLSSFETGFFNDTEAEDCFVCFADPSNYPNSPGWMLRNLLILVRRRWGLEKVQVLCYRDIQSRRDQARSVILNLKIMESSESAPTQRSEEEQTSEMPKVTGWERNRAGKLGGKVADLTEYMDPERLADQSVDLNLKLMKWRISPNLNLEKIKNTSCLLLGAGTLGSYVARNLLGWGVRRITFVDNASVSFSNPVRQPLFGFKDCLEGGAKKAQRAAEALKEIYPGVDSTGHVMSVPMAGHPVTEVPRVRKEFEQLKELIYSHDAIFLLMDTRESRWLPTVMGKAAGKIVMNAALGFDTFVVMRHGVKNEANRDAELGCYFCNDVVAPADSIKDQTLDQQCTVTRPGVAAIASALLVELLVSILQHPMGAAAPVSLTQSEDRDEHPLGIVPHQIRGYLSTFSNMVISGKSYNCCSACSDSIVDAYRTGGWEFVQKALNEQGYVEELSGLKEVQRAADAAAGDIEWDEEEGAEEDGEGELI